MLAEVLDASVVLEAARHDAALRRGSASSRRVGTVRSFAVSCAACAWLSGCAPDADGPERPENALTSREAAIVAGAPAGSHRDAVVVVEVEGIGLCSGTLVRPNLVLTARHCVAETDHGVSCAADGSVLSGARIYADVIPSRVRVLVGSSWRALRHAATGARILHDGADNLCSHDLAFVLLDHAIRDVPTAPLRLSAPDLGEPLSAVGWGQDAEGLLPELRQERDRVDVLAVAPSPQTSPRTLLTAEATCQGDSGGPLLDAHGAVVAVASYGGHTTGSPAVSRCAGADMVNVFSLVAGYPRLVDEALARADHAGELVKRAR
jgi:Trypsin